MSLCLSQNPDADALLERDPLALTIGMLLDQQIPLEKAFSSPWELAQRLGRKDLDARELAGYDPDAFAELFAARPALHRFPKAMAKRVQELGRIVAEQYGGDAAGIWTQGDPDGAELIKRLSGLPGFGATKARIFLGLLGKQYGVTANGWREAAGPFGEHGSHISVADIVDDESLQAVRAHKQQMKAAAKAKADAAG